MGVTKWQSALKDFVLKEPRLNDAINLFAQKFVAMGENKNFTLSTLTDMTWTVLVVMWEAVASGKIQGLGNVELTIMQKKYEELMKRFMETRSQYLKELAAMRDEKRQGMWNNHLEDSFNQLCPEEPIYSFVPSDAMDPVQKQFFKDAMEETVKLALIKGAQSQMSQMQDLAQEMADKDNGKEELQALLETAEEARRMAELRLEREKDTVAKLTKSGSEGAKAMMDTLQDEVSALKEQLSRQKSSENAMRERMMELEKAKADAEAALPPEPNGESEATLNLQKQMEELQRRTAQAEQRAKKAEAEVTTLEKRAADAEAQKGNDVSSAKDAKVNSLEQRLSVSEAEIQRLKDELKESKHHVLELEEAKKAASAKPKEDDTKGAKGDDKTSKEAVSMQKLNQELQKTKAEHKEEVDRLKSLVAQLESDVAAKQKELLRKSKANATERKDEEPTSAEPVIRRKSEVEIELESELDSAHKRESQLVQQLDDMGTELASAHDTQKKLEAMIQEMKMKFADLEEVLKNKGVDVDAVREAMNEVGISGILQKELSPLKVFERLYLDAMQRLQRAIHMKQKFHDLQQAELLHVLHVVHHSPSEQETSMLYTAFYQALDVSDVGSKALSLTRSGVVTPGTLSRPSSRLGTTFMTDLTSSQHASRAGMEEDLNPPHPDSVIMRPGKLGHGHILPLRPQSTPCGSGGLVLSSADDMSRRRSPSPPGRPSTEPGRERTKAESGAVRRLIIEQPESVEGLNGFTLKSFISAEESSRPPAQEVGLSEERGGVEEVFKSNPEPYPVHVVTVQPMEKEQAAKPRAKRLEPLFHPPSGTQEHRQATPQPDLDEDSLPYVLPKVHDLNAELGPPSVLQRTTHQRPRTEGQMELLVLGEQKRQPASTSACRREHSPPVEYIDSMHIASISSSDSAGQPTRPQSQGSDFKPKKPLKVFGAGHASWMLEEAPTAVQGESLGLGGSSVRPNAAKVHIRKPQQQHQLHPQQVAQQDQPRPNSANQVPSLVSFVQLQEGGPQFVQPVRSQPQSLQNSRSLPQLSPNSSGQKLRKEGSSSWLPSKIPPGQARPKKLEMKGNYVVDPQPMRISQAGQPMPQ